VSDNPTTYNARIGSDDRHYVEGPGNGCSYYAGTLWPNMRLSSVADAEAAARIANEAYRQGRDAFRRELLTLLNGGKL
jgi:hypothetical protein